VPTCEQPFKVLFVGPTSAPWDSIAPEVEVDMARLARQGIELTYRCTGAGPVEIHTGADAIAAAPFVVATVVAGAAEGFDAAIVDCTADPGVAEARELVDIPVVGPGEAMRSAIAAAKLPVIALTGDHLRAMEVAELVEQVRGAATVALGGTGFSHLVDILVAAHPGVVVLDPLTVALETCLTRLST
jgi:Asp/Glu/hydantoin racemase